MLNHVACVGLNQSYFSICCRGASTKAFRWDAFKKTAARKSGTPNDSTSLMIPFAPFTGGAFSASVGKARMFIADAFAGRFSISLELIVFPKHNSSLVNFLSLLTSS